MDLHPHVNAHRRAVVYARQDTKRPSGRTTSTSTSTSTTSTRSTSSSSSSTSTSSTSTSSSSTSSSQSSSTSRSESSTSTPINPPLRTVTSTSTIYSSTSSSARPGGSSLPSSNGSTTGATSKTGSIVGGVFGAILGLVVLLIIVAFVVRHTRKKRFRREVDEASAFNGEKFTGYEAGPGVGGSKGDRGSINGASLGYNDGNHTPYGSMNDLIPPRPPSTMERRSTPLSVPVTPSSAYGYGSGYGNGNVNMNPFSPVATVGAPPSPFALGAGPIPSPYEYEYPLQNPHYHQQYPQYAHQDGFGAPPVPGMHSPAPYGTYVNHTPPGSPFAGGYAYEQRNNRMSMGMAMGASAGARSISSPPPPPVKKTSLPDPFASPTSPLSSSPLNSYAHAKELPLPPLSLSPPPPSLPLLLPLTSPLRLQTHTTPSFSAGPGSTGTSLVDPSRDSAYSTAYSEAQVGQAVKVQVQVQGSATPVVYEELRREEGSGGASAPSSPPPPPAAEAEGGSSVSAPVSPSTMTGADTPTSAPAPAQTTGNRKKNDHRPTSAYTLYDPEDAYGGM